MSESGVQTFEFDGAAVRVVVGGDGEPWFVADDVAGRLDHSNSRMMVAGLDDDEKGVSEVDTPGGPQRMLIVSESGLYSLLNRSNKPQAKPFRRWVNHDVLPSIRRKGLYATPQTAEAILGDPDVMIRVLQEFKAEKAARLKAEERAEGLQADVAAQAAQLELAAPKARAWETFLSGAGDMSVFDAAKALARKDIVIGGNRLFKWLLERGWCYRGADGAPRAMQDRIDAGHLAHKVQGHFHPGTGEWVVDPPQVRVTPKGLDLLSRRVGQPEEKAA